MAKNKIILVILVSVLLLAVCTFFGFAGYNYSKLKDTQKEVAKDGDTLKVGISGDILGLYPDTQNEVNTATVNSSFFEGLVKFDKDFHIQPLLAKSWNNPDDKTWRISLNQGVKFQNGETLKASDVKFTFDYIQEKEFPFADNLSSIDSVKVIDDYTIDIKTKNPNPLLLNKLANVYILSEKSIKDNGPEKPVGTGPYKFVSWKKNDHVEVVGNDDYHGIKPKFQKVEYYPFENSDKIAEALRSGKIDITAGIQGKSILSNLAKDANLETTTIDDYGVSFLMPNFTDGKIEGTNLAKNPFSNTKVRQALYYGIDIQKVIASSDIASTPAKELTTSQIFGYSSEIKRYPYDIEKARSLMKEAGYESGFETTIFTSSDRENEAKNITAQLAKINIKVNVVLASTSDEFFGKIFDKKFSLALLSWTNDSGDSSDFVDGILKTNGANNFTGYSNAVIDGLANKASAVMDQRLRKEYLGEALKTASDDAVFIPLTVSKFSYVFSKNIIFEPRVDTIIKAEDIAARGSETVKKPSFMNYIFGLIGF